MKKIRSALDGLIASRKGLLALIGLVTILVTSLITLSLFIVYSKHSTINIPFEFVKDVFTAGFTAYSVIISAYAAANITQKFVEKKRGR